MIMLEKTIFVFGEEFLTVFTIFALLKRSFPSIRSLVQVCTVMQSGLFFNASSRLCNMSLLVLLGKLFTVFLSFYNSFSCILSNNESPVLNTLTLFTCFSSPPYSVWKLADLKSTDHVLSLVFKLFEFILVMFVQTLFM